VKDEIYSRRQRIAGQRVITLGTWSDSEANAQQWKRDYGQNWSAGESVSRTGYRGEETRSRGTDAGRSQRRGESGGVTHTRSSGEHEAVLADHEDFVADHEDFVELSSRTYSTFEEDANVWARDIRNLPTGHAFLRLVDSLDLHEVSVKRSPPGHLSWDTEQLALELPELLDDVDRLVQEKFQSDFFVDPSVIDAETHRRLEALDQSPSLPLVVPRNRHSTIAENTGSNPFF